MVDRIVPNIDCSQEELLQKLLSKPPDLSSHGQNWKGISMFVNCIGPTEIPEFTCSQHIVTIPTFSIKSIETKVDGKFVFGSLNRGDILVDPAQALIQQRLYEVVEGIVIHLEPSLVKTTALDNINPDSVELVQTQRREDPIVSSLGFALRKELETGQPCQLYAEGVIEGSLRNGAISEG